MDAAFGKLPRINIIYYNRKFLLCYYKIRFLTRSDNIINYDIMIHNIIYTTPIIAGTYIFFILYNIHLVVGKLQNTFYTMIMEKK